VYPVTAEPPSLAGAVHDTTACALPAVAVTPVGVPGSVLRVTAAEAADAADVPTALVAVTVNVYAVPLVRPVTVADVAPVVVIVRPPGAAVTVYPVTAEPPSLAGAVHDTTAAVFPAVAVTPVGTPGATDANGVTAAEAADAADAPATLVAVTVNVYAVPLVRPVTVAEVAPVVVIVRPPGAAVTVYPVTTEPPSPVGAVHDTTAAALPAVAVTPAGAPGTVLGVTPAEAADAGEGPAALVAVTVNV
jgi:hypothetical protein